MKFENRHYSTLLQDHFGKISKNHFYGSKSMNVNHKRIGMKSVCQIQV